MGIGPSPVVETKRAAIWLVRSFTNLDDQNVLKFLKKDLNRRITVAGYILDLRLDFIGCLKTFESFVVGNSQENETAGSIGESNKLLVQTGKLFLEFNAITFAFGQYHEKFLFCHAPGFFLSFANWQALRHKRSLRVASRDKLW